MNKLERRIYHYLNNGVYDQNLIFKEIYPTFNGHYSVLRDTIARMKNNGFR